MALGTLAGALGSAAISYGANKLFGGKSKVQAPTPVQYVDQAQINNAIGGLDKNPFVGFKGGGLEGGLDANGRVIVGADANRLGELGALRSLFPQQAAEIAALKQKVAPGMSDLRLSRFAELEANRSRAIGNLRDNLAQRRVLGSSFAQNTLATAESEFAMQKDKVAAESFMTEIEMTNQLVNQEFDLRRGEFQTALDELNLEADVAAKLSGQITELMAASARYKAQTVASLATGGGQINASAQANYNSLQAQAEAGQGKFIGELTQPLAKTFGNEVTKFFS
jgi:hypothetical protein